MLNKVILMGRLTDNPDYRQTPTGASVASFRLAVERNYQKSGEAICSAAIFIQLYMENVVSNDYSQEDMFPKYRGIRHTNINLIFRSQR